MLVFIFTDRININRKYGRIFTNFGVIVDDYLPKVYTENIRSFQIFMEPNCKIIKSGSASDTVHSTN